MIITFLVLLFSQLGFSQLIHDESYIDSSFNDFRNELTRVIAGKDVSGFKKLLANRVHESADGCGYPGCSPDDIIKFYFNERADETWVLLHQINRFGFRRVIDEYPENIVPHDPIVFRAPSYLTEIDEEMELVILGENVNIRSSASLNGKIIKQASFEKYSCDCNIMDMKKTTYQMIDGIQWIEIKLEKGNVGYVASKLTSQEVYKDLTVAKINGHWKIITFFQRSGC